MKNPLLSISLLAALACGAPEGDLFEPPVDPDAVCLHGDCDLSAIHDGDEEIGQAEFALTRTGSYGIEYDCGAPGQSTCDEAGLTSQVSAKCIVPWQFGMCQTARTKNRRIGFQAGTCSSWWQGRAVEVYNDLNALHNGAGWAWGDGGQDGTIKCGPVPGFPTYLGGTRSQSPFTDIDLPDLTTVREWQKSETFINTAAIEGQVGWSSKTEAQKQNFARNAIKHEIYHAWLVGHNNTGVMVPFFGNAAYSGNLQLTATETSSLHNYVP